jgi:hypothetical protein
MTECDEVAESLDFSDCKSFDECAAVARRAMPDESMTIIDNVAASAWRSIRRQDIPE